MSTEARKILLHLLLGPQKYTTPNGVFIYTRPSKIQGLGATLCRLANFAIQARSIIHHLRVGSVGSVARSQSQLNREPKSGRASKNSKSKFQFLAWAPLCVHSADRLIEFASGCSNYVTSALSLATWPVCLCVCCCCCCCCCFSVHWRPIECVGCANSNARESRLMLFVVVM